MTHHATGRTEGELATLAACNLQHGDRVCFAGDAKHYVVDRPHSDYPVAVRPVQS